MDKPKHLVNYPDGVRQVNDDQNRYLYLQKWLEMFRPYGYATQDDSWGELEKILDIVHRNHLALLQKAAFQELAEARKQVSDCDKKLSEIKEAQSAYGYQ